MLANGFSFLPAFIIGWYCENFSFQKWNSPLTVLSFSKNIEYFSNGGLNSSHVALERIHGSNLLKMNEAGHRRVNCNKHWSTYLSLSPSLSLFLSLSLSFSLSLSLFLAADYAFTTKPSCMWRISALVSQISA